MKSDELFRKNKKIFIRILGNKALDNHTIDRIAVELFGNKYDGSHLQDNFPLKKNKYYIINTDTKNGNGIHWVAVITTNKNMYVYDSFGRKSSELLKPLFKKATGAGMNVIDSDYDNEQRGNSQVCGQLSLAWLCIANKCGIKTALKI